MPALWFNQNIQEIFHVRFGNRRCNSTIGAFMQRRAEFLRHVRDWQASSALTEDGHRRGHAAVRLQVYDFRARGGGWELMEVLLCAPADFFRRQLAQIHHRPIGLVLF